MPNTILICSTEGEAVKCYLDLEVRITQKVLQSHFHITLVTPVPGSFVCSSAEHRKLAGQEWLVLSSL